MNNTMSPVRTSGTEKKLYQKFLGTLKKDLGAWLIMLPGLLLFIAFVWQPIVSGIILSFFETKGFEAVKFTGFQNYVDVISDSVFISAFLNSLKYTIWSLVLGFALPIIIALIINEMVHLKSFFKISVYFPNMAPGIVTAIMWLIIYDPGANGILNTIITSMGMEPSQWLQNSNLTIFLIVVSMTWKGAGGTAILYLASMQNVNDELYEAARIDGAGVWSRIFHVTLPQISGMIALCFILQVIGVFQVMVEPLAMTDGGPNNASISFMLQSYFYAFRFGQAGKSVAVSVIMFLFLMIFTVIYFAINRKNETD